MPPSFLKSRCHQYRINSWQLSPFNFWKLLCFFLLAPAASGNCLLPFEWMSSQKRCGHLLLLLLKVRLYSFQTHLGGSFIEFILHGTTSTSESCDFCQILGGSSYYLASVSFRPAMFLLSCWDSDAMTTRTFEGFYLCVQVGYILLF